MVSDKKQVPVSVPGGGAEGEGQASAPPPPPSRPGTKRRLWAACVAGLVIVASVSFLVGYYAAPRGTASGERAAMEAAQKSDGPKIRYWSCSMHPQIKMPEKGKCPICFMDLIPVYETAHGGDDQAPRLTLSRVARELAEIQTSLVEYRPLSVPIRMVGKIEYDETRLAYVAAWVPARIDKLYVNYVGVKVSKGDRLTYVYSPDLRTAQEEFLITQRQLEIARRGQNADAIAEATAFNVSARKKLELWGILPAQVAELEKSGQADDHMTIYAPSGGTVIEREAYPGKYVQTGDRLFSIADLTNVWAVLDAYELDVAWLRDGQEVVFEADAFPGESFKGQIIFIQPTLNEMTRTIKARVNVPNVGERLKPGMFIRARVDVALDEAGRVKGPASESGLAQPQAPARKALSIPVTAPLLTGARAVVYVEEQRDGETSYVGREVQLGPRAGDYYIVHAGLKEGERVVTRGNFKIDAALQIQAKPSMMKPEGGPAGVPGHQHGGIPQPGTGAAPAPPRKVAGPPEMAVALKVYIALSEALSGDDAQAAASAVDSLRQALAKAEGRELTGSGDEEFVRMVQTLRRLVPARAPKELAAQRSLLGQLSQPMGQYLAAFSHNLDFPIVEAFCPMAFEGKGGIWHQKGRNIRNPYFGSAMPQCGEVRREHNPAETGGRP